MSERLPSVRPRELIRVLEHNGWARHHQRGSHLYFHKPANPHYVSVVMHNRDLKPGTLASILRQAEISRERCLELLRE